MDRTRRPAALLATRASRSARALVPAILIAAGINASGTSAHTVDVKAIARAPEQSRAGGSWTRRPGGTANSEGSSVDLRAFPPGPGRDRFVARCGVCHTPRFVIGKRYDRPGWERIIERMIRFGADVPAPDYQVIATYLSSHFRQGRGSDLRRPGRELPGGHGGNLGSRPRRPR
jgi:hypothetical protein